MEKKEEDEKRYMKVTIPLCFDAMVPITAKLLKKQKDIKDTDDELNRQRQEFSTRMRKADERKQDLSRKEQLLVQSLREFEEFFEERERMKLESEEKFLEETEWIQQINNELARLQQRLDLLTAKKETLEQYVAKYRPAYEFLETVAKESVQFEDVGDIISFYSTLVAVHEELTEIEKANLAAIDAEKTKLMDCQTDKKNSLLTLSNAFYKLEKERDRARDEVVSLESRLSDLRSSRSIESMIFGQISMAITSMYMSVCNYERLSSVEKNPLKQLEKVRSFIQDWSEVVPEVKRMAERES